MKSRNVFIVFFFFFLSFLFIDEDGTSPDPVSVLVGNTACPIPDTESTVDNGAPSSSVTVSFILHYISWKQLLNTII